MTEPSWRQQVRRPDGTFGPKIEPGRGAASSSAAAAVDGMSDETREAVYRAAEKAALAVNTLHQRLSLAREAGEQFDGARKLWRTLGYPTDIEIPFEQYHGLYKRGDVAGRIVDAPAEGTWRRGVEIVEVDEDGNAVDPDGRTDFESEIAALFDRVDAEETFERVDAVSGIGRYGVYVIGSTKGDDLEKPISEDGLSDVEDVAFLSVFHEGHAEIASFVDDTSDPRHNLPEFYDITFREKQGNVDGSEERVHHSRVVHVAEKPTEHVVFGTPRLQRVFNRLMDVMKIAGGSAEMFWSNVGGLLWGKVPPGTEIETEGKSADEVLEETADSILEAMHEQRRVELTQGLESLEFLGGATPDPSGVWGVLKALIAAGSGPPESVIFGSERGDVAKSEDVRKWNASLAERQTRFAEPQILKPFVEFAIQTEIVSPPAAGWRADWPPLGELDEKEQAEVTKTKAEAAKAIADALVAGGDRAIEILRTLLPELEGALEIDLEGLAEYVRDEDRRTLDDIERYVEESRSEDGVGVDVA